MPSPDLRRAAGIRPAASGSRLPWALGAGIAAGAGIALFNRYRAQQAERANPPLGNFIDVDGVRLHYIEKGSGPPIVLLHGNGTMIEDWLASGLFDDLAASNRVIAIDRPGFGHSERPRSVAWTPARQASLIAAALARLGAIRPTIVGHSFGSMVAVALGLDHAAQIGPVVLIGGYYYPSLRPDVALAAPPAVPVVGDVIRYTSSPLIGAAMRRRMERRLFGPAPVSAGWRARFPFAMTLRPSQIRASAADGAMMIPAAAAMAARLGELRGPVTIIAGAADRLVFPAGQSERLARDLPHARLLIVEDAGHMVHHSATSRVAEVVRDV